MYGDVILQLIRKFQRHFPRNLQHSVGMLKITKRNQDVRFSFAISGHAWRRLTVTQCAYSNSNLSETWMKFHWNCLKPQRLPREDFFGLNRKKKIRWKNTHPRDRGSDRERNRLKVNRSSHQRSPGPKRNRSAPYTNRRGTWAPV